MLLHQKLFLFFMFLSSLSYAQSGIKAQVVDEDNKPMAQVSIQVQNNKSQLVKELTTDTDGSFSINLPSGNYTLRLSYLGYEDTTVNGIVAENKWTDLLQVALHPDLQVIDAITIKAKKPLIEQKTDRMVINVANSVLSDGLTALEILQRSPGLNVDDDGNIIMRGKSDVAVMINGKLSYLSQKELVTLLRGTSSSSLQSVELITNPSAKFDAQGLGGIINIVMKTEKRKGFNIALNGFGGAGRKARYGTGVNMNAQINSWNFQGSYDHAYRGEEEYRSFDRFFESRRSEQYSKTTEPLKTNNLKVGVDFMPNERTNLYFLWSAGFGTYNNFNHGYNNILLNTGQMTSNSLTDNANLSKWDNHNLSLGYQQRMNSRDDQLSVDIDVMKADFDANQLLIADFQKTASQNPYLSKRRNKTPSTTKLLVAKADYLIHLSNKHQLEFGVKSSFVDADNNAINDTLRGNEWVQDLQTSNHFLYEEQLHAAYLNYGLEALDWSLQAGLRMEHTDALGNQLTSQLKNPKKYTNWFPSVSLSKKISDQHQLQLSYSRRINRPDYDNLNPFRYYVDAFVYFVGNPLLQPELANAYELNYSFKNNLHLSFFYTDVKNVMTPVLTQVPEENLTIRTVANVKGFKNKGMNLNHSFKPVNLWTSINNLSLYENYYFGAFNQDVIDNRGWSMSVQSNNSFALPKQWTLELNGQFNSAESDGVFKRKPTGFVSLGVQKKLMNDKLTLKLVGNDLFKTMQYRTTSNVGSVRMNQHFNLDSRTFIFSLSLRLGKELKGAAKDKGPSEEQSRVRGGS